jgi:prepilin-type N-terminal cleavage/methylation domain-containing protein
MRDFNHQAGVRSDRGFTLNEMLVVMALMSVVTMAAYLLMSATTSMANDTEARQVATEDNRRLLDMLAREIRQAYEISDGGGAFAEVSPRQCTFYTDVNRDGVPEKVRYRIEGHDVFRAQTTATSALPPYTFGSLDSEQQVAKTVDAAWSGDVFTYYGNTYGADGKPVQVGPTEPAKVSAVQIRLVNTAHAGERSATVDLSTWVKVRAVYSTID